MKSDKKSSAAKRKKAPETGKKDEKPKTEQPIPSTAKKVVEKAAEVVSSALETTKKAATTARKAAQKVENTVKVAAEKAEKVVQKAARKKVTIPSILLEGDQPSAPAGSGPGQRYAVGQTPPAESRPAAALPEAYGTKRLIVTARDPHWLYAHWDFTRDQLREYNAVSADGHLVIRVYKNAVTGNAQTQVHVHPESRNWFIHVGEGGTRYIAELGYYDREGKWNAVTTSTPTLTPPDQLSEDTSVRFATIPIDVPFEQLLKIIKAAVIENIPLAEAIQQLRASGHKDLPAPADWSYSSWTPAQERALASLVTMDQVRRVWIGSLEITELIRRQLGQEISSISAAQLQLPSSISLGSLASPFGGGGEKQKGFWFNVNAELIIYGATEPDAKVTIGGRTIKLRPDGTFSYRFILPDGNYDLPAEATSADGDDRRSARLQFRRHTEYLGDVGAHPQDPAMKAPLVENVA